MSDQVANDLIALLDQEAEALRSAQFDVVDTIANRKQTLLQGIGARSMPRDVAAQVIAKAERNTRLYEASILGVKEAGKRLSELRSVRDGMRVYGASGQVDDVRTGTGKLERKA